MTVPRLLLGLVVGVALPAAAHERGTSYSRWELGERTAHVTVRLLEVEATHLGWWAAGGAGRDRYLGEYLARRLALVAGTTPCRVVDGPRALAEDPGRLAFEWRLACPPERPLRLRSTILGAEAPSHLHFARVIRHGKVPLERVLTGADPEWELPEAEAGTGTSLAGYVRLGVEHILSGWDHLAFVLALVLLGGSLAEVATVVTGFTVAHSVTLALAVLAHVRPAAAAVEALIGLSIALVAAENLWLRSARTWRLPVTIATGLALAAAVAAWGHGSVPPLACAGLALFALSYFGLLRQRGAAGALRWWMALVFGLVHGFGFAGALAEAGLPPGRTLPALLGFNLGVELGQLAVVAGVWPALHVLRRVSAAAWSGVVDAGSAAILALGLFWFVIRTYG